MFVKASKYIYMYNMSPEFSLKYFSASIGDPDIFIKSPDIE